ncbi:MAG TPA: hypothetical protein VIY72_14020 [Acidimicrobiales bacterium]
MRRTVVTLAVIAPLLVVVALALPSGAQTTTTDTSSTTTTTFVTPGMVDALTITGVPVCTSARSWEITWTLENVWTTPIGFLFAYSENLGGPYSNPVQSPLQLSPIEPGGTEVVVTTFPGSQQSGTAVLQTEAYFVPDGGTGGPVGVAVDLPGTCGPAEVAVAAVGTPSFTG